MGSVTVAVGGTLRSNTIENMLYEALSLACNWENDVVKNPTAEKKVSLTEDKAEKRVTANFTFKINRERTSTGSTSFPVQTHLVSTGYAAGTTPAIVSTNIYAAIVEICEEIQKRDADVNKNPMGLNTVTSLNYDSEALTVTGSISQSFDFTPDAQGNIVSRAKTYLVD